MFYLIFAIVLFLSLMVLGGLFLHWNDEYFVKTFGFSIMITFFITFVIFMYNERKETNQCLEKNLRIVPKIIYTSDSSRKILQYNFEDKVREIELKKENSDYYIPESLLLIEPCLNNLEIKK